MTWPAPQPGLVIRYSYLWTRESQAGREEDVKDRPCAIILAVVTAPGRTRVIVLPITHTTPQLPDAGIELTAQTKARLGLDDERSWIVLDEGNDSCCSTGWIAGTSPAIIWEDSMGEPHRRRIKPGMPTLNETGPDAPGNPWYSPRNA